MKFFRSKAEEPKEEGRYLLMRKADVGDTVSFKANKNGESAYWPHVSHRGVVIGVVLRSIRNRPSTRAIYAVECECGSILHPRGSEFDLAK